MVTTYAFQPETVEALASAFQMSWQFLSRDPHFAAVSEVPLQHELSLCLFDLAADGERDPLRLANGAIFGLRSRMHSVLDVRRQAKIGSARAQQQAQDWQSRTGAAEPTSDGRRERPMTSDRDSRRSSRGRRS